MSNQKECASILLRRGVHPSQPDGDGRTPLHLAAARGQKALVSLLLSYNGVVILFIIVFLNVLVLFVVFNHC